jgi:cytochrome c oxidase assembly protein subunit 15
MNTPPTALPYATAGAHVAVPSSRALHRFSIAIAISTFVLIVIGSTVTTTNSGLAVPDWPTTFDQNMWTYPPSQWVGGVFYEHGHRIVASLVGFLTLIQCVWLWAMRSPRWMKRTGLIALFAVCLQGMLGGLTVRYQLPVPISVSHAGLAELFLGLTIFLAFATHPHRITWRTPTGELLRTWRLGSVMLVMVFAQIVVGAVMRHTHSGLAIPDFPASYGRVLPPADAAALDAINAERAWAFDDGPAQAAIDPVALNLATEPVTLAQIWIHFGHRLGAVVVLICAIGVVMRAPQHTGRLAWLAFALLGMVVVQGFLGGMVIWSGRDAVTTTLHIGAGAATMAIAVALFLTPLCTRSPADSPA